MVFKHDSVQEISKIIFEGQRSECSPRMDFYVQFQIQIYQHLDKLGQIFNDTSQETKEDSKHDSRIDYSHTNTRKLQHQKTIAYKLKTVNTVAISDELTVIKHSHARPERKSSRNPTLFSKNSKSKDKSRSSIFKTHPTKAIFEEEQINKDENKSESVMSFDPDFLLSSVFGYQDFMINTPDGMFSVFEPVKRRSYANEPEVTQNL